MAAPERYAPAYGGWCAWAMLEGDAVKVDPEAYRIADGRLLVFYRGVLGDTLKKWSAKATAGDEAAMLTRADRQWITLQN